MQPHNPIRIQLVEDHSIVRAGLRMLIESHPGLIVVGEAANGAEALALAESRQPDIILLDLGLGQESGLDLLPRLQSVAGRARVILLTGVRDPEQHRRAVRLGAMGVVLKEEAAQVLLDAVQKVHAGEVWLDPSMVASMLGGGPNRLAERARVRDHCAAVPGDVKQAGGEPVIDQRSDGALPPGAHLPEAGRGRPPRAGDLRLPPRAGQTEVDPPRVGTLAHRTHPESCLHAPYPGYTSPDGAT
jgi:DNA-binding NarL/FixJ family response regulator